MGRKDRYRHISTGTCRGSFAAIDGMLVARSSGDEFASALGVQSGFLLLY